MKKTPTASQLNRQYEDLRTAYTAWESYFVEAAENFDPGRQRFDLGNTNKKHSHNTKMIDPTPKMAANILSAGMMAGVTNPSVPWVVLNVAGAKDQAAEQWLFNASREVLYALAKSNFYNICPSIYSDLAIYCTANVVMESDAKSVLRFYHKPIGSYCIKNGSRNTIETWTNAEMKTSDQLVDNFGIENVSDKVKNAYERKDFSTKFEVRRLIMPRKDFDPKKKDNKNMPYASYWFEPGEDDGLLRESGFKRFPAATVRWEVVGNDSYGSFGPGMVALGTAKGLQLDAKQRFKAQEMMLDPPINVPISMKNTAINRMPGGVNYVNSGINGQRVESLYNMNFNIDTALAAIADDRQMIKSAFFNDLFIMIANQNTHQMTATEVAARKEEKLLMLGPVMNRLSEEFLDVVVERTFDELLERGILPEPPESLAGKPIEIEYTSILYQALRAVGMGSIERATSYIGNIAGIRPDALDNFNVDGAVREYVSITGANPIMLHTPEEVAAVRKARAEAAQAEKMAAMAQPAQQAAQAAKVMSETDTGNGNVLEMLTGRA